jgi:sodium/proline symporter
MDDQSKILIVMITYMSLLVLWGFYQGRKVKTSSDFAIAGRKLPGWVAALSERATGESSWALLGLPGAAYATGLMEIWTAIGCVLGIILAWVVLAWRLRDEAAKYETNTFTEYIAKKHGEVGKWIRIVGSFTIVFFFFFYVGAQFIGGGKTLENLFGIDRVAGMLIIVAFVVPYTIYGGFRSVTYSDVIQAIVMIIALVVAPIAGIIYLTNQPEGSVFAFSISEALDKAGPVYNTMTGGKALSGFGTGLMIAGAFSWFFGYLGGLPQLTTRFMAIKNARQAKQARNIGVIWTIIAYTGALMIGWLAIAVFGPGTIKDRETVMPIMLTTLFNPWVAGILLTGVLAAVVSTANSLLILSATELSENLIQPFRKLKPKRALLQSRIVTALLSVVALVLAYFSFEPVYLSDNSMNSLSEQITEISVLERTSVLVDKEFNNKKDFLTALKEILTPKEFASYNEIFYLNVEKDSGIIYTLVGYVWAGIGSTFSIVILLTLFWKRFHGRAALATIVTGLVFTIVWISTGLDKTVITARLMTFVVAFIIAVGTTYLIPKRT